MPMNTANKLTLARVFMIPLFLVIVYWGFPGSRYVALAEGRSGCLSRNPCKSLKPMLST